MFTTAKKVDESKRISSRFPAIIPHYSEKSSAEDKSFAEDVSISSRLESLGLKPNATSDDNPCSPRSYLREFSELNSQPTKTYDLTAKLVCRVNVHQEWSLYLTDIQGEKVAFLFGRSFLASDTLALDDLIPIEQQTKHNERIASVLEKGPSSPYWALLFENMMSRTIKILNPQTQQPRFVKIQMALNPLTISSQLEYVFDVTLTDQTVQEEASHNLRGLMRHGINTVQHRNSTLTREQFMSLTPELLGQFYDSHQESDAVLLEMFQEGLKLCSTTPRSLLTRRRIRSVSAEGHDEIADSRLKPTSQMPHYGCPYALFSEKSPILQEAQYARLHDLASNTQLAGIILLVDDSLTAIKILIGQVTSIIYPNPQDRPVDMSNHSKTVKGDLWQSLDFVIEMRANWAVVCAANGLVALEIVKTCPVSFMITDFEMPKMNGINLIRSIRLNEQSNASRSMPIALCTALSFSELLTQMPDADLEKLRVTTIIKGAKLSEVSEFLSASGFPSASLDSSNAASFIASS